MVMVDKEGGKTEGEEGLLSPRKRGPKKFVMKSTQDDIDTAEPLRRALRQPMQCSIMEYLAASRAARDELQVITRKTCIPMGDEITGGPSIETPLVVVSGTMVEEFVVREDRPVTVYLDGREGGTPNVFYVLGNTVLNNQMTVQGVIDNGCEAIIIDDELAKRLKLDLDRTNKFEIETVDAKRQEVVGVCHKATIDVCGVRVRIPLLVVRDCSAEILLGRTWLSYVHVVNVEQPDGSRMLSIKHHDGARIALETVQPRDPRNRATLTVTHAQEIVTPPVSNRPASYLELMETGKVKDDEGLMG
ncbi:hypothetical protein CBR_g19629 [Chara braunii]|uniref:Aspartic peptidase DDI1-type domain-containing protein n=1 Tax=Chara braunii TaxID=69332 RepID=A0A388KYH8_CHABU|nr:hypothetical protein CBR_g19629 [Chara braunii]|eukprot:GBG75116.1 hypothetical protein CBR_g19629 [Chara braunii]